MEKANQGLLLYHTPAELLKGILKLVDLEDLLHLSTSCRLFRNIMDKHFWQYCVISRDLDLDLFEDPRKKAIYHVTRTCHECRCRSSTDIPAHYFIKKRLCRACKNTKYRTVTVGTAKRKYTITEEQLGKLQGAKVTNPHNSGFAPMRLFLLSDIQAVAQRRLNKLQKRRIVLERRKLREEQKLAEKQAASKLSKLVLAWHTKAASNSANTRAACEQCDLLDALKSESLKDASHNDVAHSEATHKQQVHMGTAHMIVPGKPSKKDSSSMPVD